MTALPKLERGVAAMAFACWPVGGILLLLEGPWRGLLPVDLYRYFGAAMALGWLAGNLCVFRSRRAPSAALRTLRGVYLFCPPALLCVARAFATTEQLVAVPLAPLLGLAVYAVFFALPLSLRRAG